MGLNNMPVLYIAFARPEYARQSFDAIKAAKPKKLYFYSNKGRVGHGDELERNNQVRAMINEIDWECDLHTWFRDECVDVYTSLFGAINWLFDNEEMGIILEEDCVASPAFFDFAEKMLLKYKDDKRIWMVAGSNYVEGCNPHNHDYHFSRNMFIHGWASWRDRWKSIDWDNLHLREMIDEGVFESVWGDKLQCKFHKSRIISHLQFIEKTRCWDLCFTATGRSRNTVSIIPEYNLIDNVGVIGCHTNVKSKKNVQFGRKKLNSDSYTINNEPKFVVADVDFDKELFRRIHWLSMPLYRRILFLLKK